MTDTIIQTPDQLLAAWRSVRAWQEDTGERDCAIHGNGPDALLFSSLCEKEAALFDAILATSGQPGSASAILVVLHDQLEAGIELSDHEVAAMGSAIIQIAPA